MGYTNSRSIGRLRRRMTTAMAAVIALVVGTVWLVGASPVAAGSPTATLVFVAGTNGPPNGDKPIVAMAEDLGFDVIVIDDDTPDLATIVESFTPAVIVISTTVVPNKIRDTFTDSPRPIVTWEPYLYDDLGMTKNHAGHRGQVSSRTAIRIADATHPITAPLSSNIAVTSKSRPMSYGVPAGDVQTLATISGSTSKAAILVAETGDELADGVSAGVRVGLFMTSKSPTVLTDNGAAMVGKAISWAGNFVPPAPNLAPVVDAGDDITIMLPTDTALLDATVTDDGVQLATPVVTWSGPAGATFDDASATDTNVSFADAGTYVLTMTADDGELQTSDDVQVTVQDPDAPAGTQVMFVSGRTSPIPANDQVIVGMLLDAGIDVVHVDDNDLPADISAVDGIVISTSVNANKVKATFTDVDLPILTWEGYLLNDLGLTTKAHGETPGSTTAINITDPSHPLAAGQRGYTSVLTHRSRMTFAKVGPGADVVAYQGSPNAGRAVLFTYLTDAPLPGGGVAPARRVVAFPNFVGSGRLNEVGMDIMEAAIAFFLVPDNEPPIVDDQSFDVDENSPVGTAFGSITFTDPDLTSGDLVTIAATGGSGATAFDVDAGGDVTVADSAQLDFEATPSLTLDVVAMDSAGDTDTATITIHLRDVNEQPDVASQSFSVDENSAVGTVVGTVAAADPDGDALTFTEASPGGNTDVAVSAGGDITVVNGALDAESTSRVTIDVVASDGSLDDTATITITINDVAEAPTDIGLSPAMVDENDAAAAIGTLSVVDHDGAPHTFEVLAPDDDSFEIVGTTLKLRDGVALDHESTPTVDVSVRVVDSTGLSFDEEQTVTVDDVNEAPDAVDDGFGLASSNLDGTAISIVGNDTDPDGDALVIVASSVGPLDTASPVTSAGGRSATITISDSAPQYDLTLGTNFRDLGEGETDTITVTYTISDPSGLTDTAEVLVTVGGVNDAPVALDDSFTVAEGALLTDDLLANDSDLDTNDVLTITGAGGVGVDSDFGVTSADGRTGTARVAPSGAVNVEFDQDGKFEDLAVGEIDTVDFDYDIADGNGGTDTGTVTVTVTGANDAPTAADDAFTIDEDGALSGDILGNDTDPDGDNLGVSSVDGNATGAFFDVTSTGGRTASVNVSSGAPQNLSVDLLGNFADLVAGESDSLTVDYAISDGNGGTDTATVSITINGQDNPPVAADFGVAAVGNTQLRSGTGETGPVSPPAKLVADNLVTASANTTSAVPASGQATSQGGSVDINADGSFVYTPPTGFVGDDTFTYTVVGEGAQTDTGTITVTVADLVWYVSTTGNSGDTGRSNDPFGAEQVDRAAIGDTVYFFPSASDYDTGGWQPLTGQTWIGAGVPLVVSGVSLAPAGTAPTLGQLSAVSSADVTLRGLTIAGLASFGGAHRLAISDVAVTRYLILIGSTDIAIDIDSFTDAGGGGVNLTNVSGTTTIDSFNATTLGGGTPAYLNLDNAGSVTINGTANTISKPNGPVINIVNTTIGGSGASGAMAFQSLTGQSIVLTNASGGFAVTGTAGDTVCGGSTVSTCSGGTVGSVSLTNVSGISLNKLKVLDSGGDAIAITTSSHVTILNSEIIGAGDADGEHAVDVVQMGGAFTLAASLITGFHDTGLRASNTSGSATFNVNGNMFSDNHETPGSGGQGENAIDIRAAVGGSADLMVNVTNNFFDDIEISAVKIVNESGSATIDANVNGNDIRDLGGADDFPTAPAIELVTDNLGALTFDVKSNTITASPGDGISVSGDGALVGRIGGPAAVDGNTIGNIALGDGINIDISGENASDDFDAVILVQNNTISAVGDDGIQILHRDNTGSLDLTIEDNSIADTASEAIRFFSDHDLGSAAGEPFTNLKIEDNSFSAIGTIFTPPDAVVYLRSRDTASLCTSINANSGFTGDRVNEIDLLVDVTAALVVTQTLGQLVANNGGAAVAAEAGVSFGGSCAVPALPTNP